MSDGVHLMLVRNGPVRYLPDDTDKLVRMVRRSHTGSARDLLPLREPVGDAAGVDDLDVWVIFASGLRECQTLGEVPQLDVDDQNADARGCAEKVESLLNTGRH